MNNSTFITGDIHRDLNDLKDRINRSQAKRLIILGDAAVNWYGPIQDYYFKKVLSDLDCEFFLLRGNHDQPPEEVPNMLKVFNPEIDNFVYMETEFPKIQYLIDGLVYIFDSYKCLAIGGAYSIDKYLRLSYGWQWFEHEQICYKDRQLIAEQIAHQDYDFILTHTCPYSWMPTDKFLAGYDQSKIDNSMELWLEDIKDTFTYKVWLFGHYHIDRIVKPNVESMYYNINSLDSFIQKYNEYIPLDKS